MGNRGTPRLTSDEVIDVLRRHGFALVGQSGSHQKWRNSMTSKQVIVAHHRGRILPLGTMKAIVEGNLLQHIEARVVLRKHLRDCHVGPDWVPIHKIVGDELHLARKGTHSDWF